MSAFGEDSLELKILLKNLITKAHHLLPEVISQTRENDIHSRIVGADWLERHRLHVLLDAAEKSLASLPKQSINPWFLSELQVSLDTIEKWSTVDAWSEIKPALANPTFFNHTIVTLVMADHMQSMGHSVKIVGTKSTPTPDLKFQAIGGTQEWVAVECYQPKILNGKKINLSTSELKNAIERAFDKARLQISRESLGIIAICGYNQSTNNIRTLKKAIRDRLQKTDRPNLCGVAMLSLGVQMMPNRNLTSFRSILTVDFVHNLSYFGNAEVSDRPQETTPSLVKDRMVDVLTQDDFVLKVNASDLGLVMDVEENTESEIVDDHTRVIRTHIIQEPKDKTRVVLCSKEKDNFPLIIGKGNIDFHCGHCDNRLLKQCWKDFLFNIVIKCPKCDSYNDFPDRKLPEYPRVNSIAIEAEVYYFSSSVVAKHGVVIVGVPHGFHLTYAPTRK